MMKTDPLGWSESGQFERNLKVKREYQEMDLFEVGAIVQQGGHLLCTWATWVRSSAPYMVH